MDSQTPAFIACAMEATEQGIRAEDIKEECACRMGLLHYDNESTSTNN